MNFVKKYLKFDHNSTFQRALERKVLQIEIKKHYKTLSELDLKTYNLHSKLYNYLGTHIWKNLEQLVTKKDEIWGKKFRNLQKPKPSETLSNQNLSNVVNLSTEEFSKEKIILLNQGLETCVGFCSNVENYVADIETTIFNQKEEDKQIIRKKM